MKPMGRGETGDVECVSGGVGMGHRVCARRGGGLLCGCLCGGACDVGVGGALAQGTSSGRRERH